MCFSLCSMISQNVHCCSCSTLFCVVHMFCVFELSLALLFQCGIKSYCAETCAEIRSLVQKSKALFGNLYGHRKLRNKCVRKSKAFAENCAGMLLELFHLHLNCSKLFSIHLSSTLYVFVVCLKCSDCNQCLGFRA